MFGGHGAESMMGADVLRIEATANHAKKTNSTTRQKTTTLSPWVTAMTAPTAARQQ